jgi:hypothetical protein
MADGGLTSRRATRLLAWLTAQHFCAVSPGDIGRVVAAAVVDHEHLIIWPLGDVDRLEGVPEQQLFVVGRDHHKKANRWWIVATLWSTEEDRRQCHRSQVERRQAAWNEDDDC